MSDKKQFLSPAALPSLVRKQDIEDFPMLDSPQRTSDTAKKVPPAPGHSSMDWAKLQASGSGATQQLVRITVSELAKHASKNDCWIALQGKVYNVTSYLKFHPGGVGQLMRGAGKDATELFFNTHPWVNADRLIAKCHIGFLISD